MAEEKLFLRKATGLVREVGFWTAVIVILCHVIGLGWQKRVFQAAGWAPVKAQDYFLGIHPMIMSFLIGGVIVLITVYCISVMSAAMPRSGGGYVFISRILNPQLGFVSAWLGMLSTTVSYGLIAVAVAEAVFFIFGDLAGFKAPDALTTPIGLFILGAIIIGIFSGVATLGVRQWGLFLQTIFGVPAVILVLVYIMFLMATPASMEAGVKALLGGHAPSEYTALAIKQGIDKAAVPYWSAVSTAMIASIWAYGGWYAASFIAGEVKEASKSLPRIMFTAGIIIILVYMTISFLLNRAGAMVGQQGGWSFIDAMAFLRFGGGPDWKGFGDLPGRAATWMTYFAGIQAAGMGLAVGPGVAFPWMGWLLLLMGTLWVANDIPPFVLVTSRTCFAMAFDRVMPEKFGEISEKYHSPVWAIWFISILALLLGATSEADLFSKGGIYLGEFFYTWLNPAVTLGGTDLWSSWYEFWMMVAAFMLPLRKADVFERSPWKQSKTMVQTVAVIAALAEVWLFWVFLTDKHSLDFLGALASGDVVAMVPTLFSIVLALIGWGIYLYYANQAKVTGVNLRTIYAEIPPE